MKLNVLLGDAYKEGMTADEIISALEKVADPSAEVEKLRNAVTKANGEAAEYKKQSVPMTRMLHRNRLTSWQRCRSRLKP